MTGPELTLSRGLVLSHPRLVQMRKLRPEAFSNFRRVILGVSGRAGPKSFWLQQT